MIRAHLRRFIGGGLGGPLRDERTGSTPRVRPSGAALQLDPSHRSSHGFCDRLPGAVREKSVRDDRRSSAGFAGAIDSWGEVRKGGEAPLRGKIWLTASAGWSIFAPSRRGTGTRS